MKEHLTRTGGHVKGCEKASVEIQTKVSASMQAKEKIQLTKKRNQEILRSHAIDVSDEDGDEVLEEPEVIIRKKATNKRKHVSASNVRGPLDAMLKTNLGKTKQKTYLI